MKRRLLPSLAVLAIWAVGIAHAAIDPALQVKIDQQLVSAKALAAEPAIVAAAKSYDAAPSFDALMMTQEQWAELNVGDSALSGLSDSAASAVLGRSGSPAVLELFVSGANGGKIAFVGKPETWSDEGLPRLEVPLKGEVWQREYTADGKSVVEVAVPVLLGYKPIGVLVIKLDPRKLK